MVEAEVTPAPERQAEPGSNLGPVVAGVLLLAVGLLWLLDALDVVDLDASVVLPGILLLIGVALIAGSFSGPHGGLVGFGVFLTVVVVMVAAFPSNPLRGGVGERNLIVADQAELEESYGVGLGELTLDLSELELSESAAVDVNVGAGEILVTLPPELAVSIDASAGAGDIDLLGETADGVGASRRFVSPGFDEADVTLTLDLNVSAGQIRVRR